MLLDYVESQMLSHANGYMWYANRGAWGDVNNIIIGMDMCLMFINSLWNTPKRVRFLFAAAEKNKKIQRRMTWEQSTKN